MAETKTKRDPRIIQREQSLCFFEGRDDYPCKYPGVLVLKNICDCGYTRCPHWPSMHHPEGDRSVEPFLAHHGCNSSEAARHPRNRPRQLKAIRALIAVSPIASRLGGQAIAKKFREDLVFAQRMKKFKKKAGRIGGKIGGRSIANRLKSDPEFAEEFKKQSSRNGKTVSQIQRSCPNGCGLVSNPGCIGYHILSGKCRG